MKVQRILFLFLVALGSGGCTPSQTIVREKQVMPLVSSEEAVPTQPPLSTLPLLSPTQGDNSPMTPILPGLQSLIEKAKEDLAKRLSITVVEINVAEAAGVIWPDSSLGCPQKGMAYAQVLTQGYRILLEYAKNQYEYHAGKSPEVFYCPNPTPPVPNAPGDN